MTKTSKFGKSDSGSSRAPSKKPFGNGLATDSREQLAEAIREEKSLKVCAKHPRTVYFDGPKCPACQAEREFLKLTSGKFSNPRIRG